MTFWHGGGPIVGDLVLPPLITGHSRSDDDARVVHVTTDRDLAATYASTVRHATAWLYEVEPLSTPIPRASLVRPDAEPISYTCHAARIVRRFTISNAERLARRAVVL